MTLAKKKQILSDMGTIDQSRAITSLNAQGTHTGPNLSGSVSIGISTAHNVLTDADVAYSATITSTAYLDIASLDLATGIITQTAGAPVIEGGDGNDFEGDTLPTSGYIYGIMATVEDPTSSTIRITPTTQALPSIIMSEIGQVSLFSSPVAVPITGETVAIVFNGTAGQKISLTIIGKTI